MAISDWNTANSHRSYPFQENPEASGLRPDEILDARFFIVNPEFENPEVWLHQKRTGDGFRLYTFMTSAFSGPLRSTLTFRVPDSEESQCVWNMDNEDWNGFCVFGGVE